MLSGVQAAIC